MGTIFRNNKQYGGGNGGGGGQGASSADAVSYNNTSTDLTSNNVQDAISELDQNKANKTDIPSVPSWAMNDNPPSADKISYDNSPSAMFNPNNVQDAIDDLITYKVDTQDPWMFGSVLINSSNSYVEDNMSVSIMNGRADGYNSVAITDSFTKGEGATAINSAYANGEGSTAIHGATANGACSYSSGWGSEANGDLDTVIGNYSTSNKDNTESIIVGNYNKNGHIMFGSHLNGETSDGTIVSDTIIGTYNSVPDDNKNYSLIIAAGNENDNFNAMEVSYNEDNNKFETKIPNLITTDLIADSISLSNGSGIYIKPSNGIPESDLAQSVKDSLSKADTALQSFTESDPTVPSWAKQPNPPTYSATDVGALPDTTTHLSGDIPISEKGASNGVATLGSDGKIPSSQLPSYVDDVLEYNGKSKFPTTGESGKIYVDTSDNKTYRWSGSTYVEISPSVVIGTTTGTAFDGKSGKDHVDNTTVHITSAERTKWNGKQDALTSQTAYTSKGSATKVPQITTNSLGQVTGITEVTITQPTVPTIANNLTTTTTGKTLDATQGKALNDKIDNKIDKTRDGVNEAINLLPSGATTPSDDDYYISQYANGGTTTTTYYRRPIKALWEYIKSKINGEGYAKKTEITEECKNYLPITGGTLTGTLKTDNPIQMFDGKNYVAPVKVYDDGDEVNYGSELVITGNGNTFIGGGESPTNVRKEFLDGNIKDGETYGQVGEHTFITSDQYINFLTNCQTASNRKGMLIDNNGTLKPYVNKGSSLGTNALKWNEIYGSSYISDSKFQYVGSTNQSAYLNIKSNFEKGTKPSSTVYWTLNNTDKVSETSHATKNRLGILETYVDTNGNVGTRISAFKNEKDSTAASILTAMYAADGTTYATAPTPSDANDSSTKIATTAWVNNKKYLPIQNITLYTQAQIDAGQANWDLNNFKTFGIYYIPSPSSSKGEVKVANMPGSISNGWLLVLPSTSGTVIKQIWTRHGTVDSNDYETYVRLLTFGSSATVGDWRRFAMIDDVQNTLKWNTLITATGAQLKQGIKIPVSTLTKYNELKVEIVPYELSEAWQFGAIETRNIDIIRLFNGYTIHSDKVNIITATNNAPSSKNYSCGLVFSQPNSSELVIKADDIERGGIASTNGDITSTSSSRYFGQCRVYAR